MIFTFLDDILLDVSYHLYNKNKIPKYDGPALPKGVKIGESVVSLEVTREIFNDLIKNARSLKAVGLRIGIVSEDVVCCTFPTGVTAVLKAEPIPNWQLMNENYRFKKSFYYLIYKFFN